MLEVPTAGRTSAAWLNADGAMTAIARAYDIAQDAAADALGWYQKAMKRRGRAARAIRFVALVAFGVGGLIPIARAFLPSGGLPGQPGLPWVDLGYVALAVGAGLIGFDYFFGISSAYTRFVTTETAIRLARTRFEADWMLLIGGAGAAQTAAPAKLEPRLRAYVELVAQLVERETQEWVAEFRSSLSELERMGGHGGAGGGAGRAAARNGTGATPEESATTRAEGGRAGEDAVAG